MSWTHLQGVGFQPTLQGRRDMFSHLAAFRQLSASVRFVLYVSNDGDGIHSVQNQCNATPYQVAGLPGLSFEPGTQVTLASNAGTPGELLIGEAPLGRQGGASNPAQAVRARGRYGLARPGTCPVRLSGRSYVGVSLFGDLKAFAYLDGACGDLIAQISPPTFGSGYGWQRSAAAGPERLVCVGSFDGETVQYWTWDLEANAIAAATRAGIANPSYVSPPILLGASYFFAVIDQSGATPSAQLFEVPIGFDGDVTDDMKRGLPREGHYSGRIGSPGLPAIELGGPDLAGIPYHDGAFWHDGAARSLLQAEGEVGISSVGGGAQLGLPVAGGRSSLIVNGGPALLGKPPTGSAELIVPADWSPTVASYGFPAVAPSGTEYACFPVVLPGDTDGGLLRLRVGVTTWKSGCPVPIHYVEDTPDGQQPLAMLPRDF
jgi:hypothetical protein